MKNSEKDILDNLNLKTMPYGVPEGYFEEMKSRLKTIPKQHTDVNIMRHKRMKLLTRIAIAASIVLALIGGGLLLTHTSDDMYLDRVAIAETITEEDIIEYLIYTGAEIEDIEQY